MGAWIEIDDGYDEIARGHGVAPFMGAWIEMLKQI